MDKAALKTTVGIVLVVIVLFAVGYVYGLFPTQTQDSEPKEPLAYIADDYFLFPDEDVVSYGINADLEEEVADYEELAKDKEAILVLEYNDANGEMQSVFGKVFPLTDENIAYTLRHYTDYFTHRNFLRTKPVYRFSIDPLKEDDFLRDVHSGAIIVSNRKIHIFMSDNQEIETFLNIFEANNGAIDQTFLQYLERNQDVLARVVEAVDTAAAEKQQARASVSKEARAFAKSFWDAYVVLDTEQLKDYYADDVWFYAEEEWFDEWGIEGNQERRFVAIDSESLLRAYKEIKAEDFEEELPGIRAINPAVEVYDADDFMTLCHGENREAFFDNFRIESGDLIVAVRLDGGATCTVDGKFFGGELRFWVLRDTDEGVKVVTDFTE